MLSHQLVKLFDKDKRYCSFGGSVSLGVGFKVSKAHFRLRFSLSLSYDYNFQNRCEFSAPSAVPYLPAITLPTMKIMYESYNLQSNPN